MAKEKKRRPAKGSMGYYQELCRKAMELGAQGASVEEIAKKLSTDVQTVRLCLGKEK